MSENVAKTEQPNFNQVREKLLSLVMLWAGNLPEILNMNPNLGMSEKMLLNTFRPFLPKLQDSLTSKIDSLTDEELQVMIDKLESAFQWLKAND